MRGRRGAARFAKAIDRVTDTVFVGFGLRLLFDKGR